MFEKMQKLLNEMEEWNEQCEYWSLSYIKKENTQIIIVLEIDQEYLFEYEGGSNELIIKCPEKAFNNEKIFTILYNIVKEFGLDTGYWEEENDYIKSNKTLLDNNNVDITFKENEEGIGSRMYHH